jgi:hypothetical protein
MGGGGVWDRDTKCLFAPQLTDPGGKGGAQGGHGSERGGR